MLRATLCSRGRIATRGSRARLQRNDASTGPASVSPSRVQKVARDATGRPSNSRARRPSRAARMPSSMQAEAGPRGIEAGSAPVAVAPVGSSALSQAERAPAASGEASTKATRSRVDPRPARLDVRWSPVGGPDGPFIPQRRVGSASAVSCAADSNNPVPPDASLMAWPQCFKSVGVTANGIVGASSRPRVVNTTTVTKMKFIFTIRALSNSGLRRTPLRPATTPRPLPRGTPVGTPGPWLARWLPSSAAACRAGRRERGTQRPRTPPHPPTRPRSRIR